MGATSISSGNQVKRWAATWYYEYVRDMQLSELIGDSENDPIQVKTELTKQSGAQISLSLVGRLTGAGVTGDNTLKNNEEELDDYAHVITIDQLRNAVSRGNHEQQKTHIDILRAGRVVLKLWAMAADRDDILAAMQSPVTDGSTAYGSATEDQKDTWVAAQNPASGNHRVVFGNALANYSTGDHSASLLTITSAMTLSRSLIRLIKRAAKRADPHIRPIATSDGERFILLAQSYAFRDLETEMATELASAHYRGDKNPLFKGGDLKVGNVIIKEVEEIPVISGVGNGGIDVAPCFLLGAQAVGIAVGQRPTPISDTDDYGNLRGAGVKMTRGIDKLMFQSDGTVQHGMLTFYIAGVADG